MTPLARPWPNLVIRASAGTGKTYQLSNRYLQLVADGQPPEQILASTFARKAAGEILARVLVRLADAALDGTARKQFAASLDRELDAAACHELLGSLLANLHRLRIGTLDSFFVQLAGGLTLELGLPTGWQIVDPLDDRSMRLEAIRRVLEGGTTAELSALLHLLFKGEATRSITEQIADIVDELYSVYAETDRAAWHGLARLPVLKSDQLAAAIDGLATATPPTDGRHAKAWQQDVERASTLDWEEFLGKGLAGALFQGDGLYYRKPVDESLAALYGPLIKHAQGVLLGRVVDQTEATYKLLDAFHGQYQNIKLARRGLRFDDLPRLLAGGLTDGLMDHAAWRLDTSIDHLLLDEFQDTSLAQWSVLEPFAQAACDSRRGRSFFCVGDVKQAIYRWRGGVSQIFDAVRGELPDICEQSLDASYRSCPQVIDTVNRVFGNLPGNQALADFPAVTAAWRGGFATHATMKTDLAGHCALWVAPRAGDDEKQVAVTERYAAVLVARLAREQPGRSIGVLVRRNATVARLIHLLRSEHQVQASEEGGNPLDDAPPVQLLLALVKLADHPGDSVARFHVAGSPLGAALGFINHDDLPAAARSAAALRRQLLTDGFGHTLYGWVQMLAAHCSPRDVRRLTQLVELGYAFDQRESTRASQFVEFVEVTKVEDPTAADVRVMTVHQAKGLQFDIVVAPELDVSLKPGAPGFAVGRPRPIDKIERVCRYVNEDLRALLPADYRPIFDQWPIEAVNESLCLLYVTLTRAVHALYLMVAPSGTLKSGKPAPVPKTFAGVLRSALTDGGPLAPDSVAFELGSPDWPQRTPLAAPASSTAAAAAEPLVVRLRPAGSVVRELERRSPSSLEGGGRVRLGERLQLEADAAFGRGQLWHSWLEQIEWLDPAAKDGAVPTADELRRRAQTIDHELDLEPQIEAFRRQLGQPEIRAVLSRAGYADFASLGWPPAWQADLGGGVAQLEVWRERRFVVREPSGLLSGSIDRLVLLVRDGRVSAADVLDFKTDRLTDAGALAGKIEFYRPQLAAYRAAVGRLYGLETSQIITRLVFLETGRVCVVG